VQINGRKRISLDVPASLTHEELEAHALQAAKEKGLLVSSLKKTVVVPHKHLVNFVTH
jgi:hypothetical protein